MTDSQPRQDRDKKNTPNARKYWSVLKTRLKKEGSREPGSGISSNMKMVVDGSKGEFAVLSGNALLLLTANGRKILSLPPEIDFKGTMIMVRIPAQMPDKFNLYDYMS